MNIKKLIFLFACVGMLLSMAIGCSHSDELAEQTPQNDGSTISQLVNGKRNDILICCYENKYVRAIGESDWKEFNREIDSTSSEEISDRTEAHFPMPIIFRDSECFIDLFLNIPNPDYESSLLERCLAAYGQKTNLPYRIFIRVPYEFEPQERILKLGNVKYTVESDDSEKLLFEYRSSNGDKEYKTICTYTVALPIIDLSEMLVYDTYEQMHDDVITRLKDTFGEEIDLSLFLSTSNRKVRFEELEKEMAEMAYECPYWFAPKPAWR